MNIAALTMFIDVARAGSFAKLARERDIDPSIVSRHIAQLEVDLGTRLFHRTTRRISLTEAGARLFEALPGQLDALDRTLHETIDLHKAPGGTMRVSTSTAFGIRRLVPLLEQFRRDFPDIDLELLMTDENVDVVEHRIDLAIRLGPEVTGNHVVTKLMDTRYRVVASRTYLETSAAVEKPQDLQGHKILSFMLPTFDKRWVFSRGKKAVDVEIDPCLKISNALALRDAARAGLGVSLLADWLVDDDIADGSLVDVFPDHDVAATTFQTAAWLVYPSRQFVPGKTRATIDFLKAALSSKA